MRAKALGPALALAMVVAGSAFVGCILVTSGTDGYSVVDSGASSCMAAADCEAGSVCCLVVNAASTSTAGTCASSCSLSYPQLCKATSECGDAGACTKQSCTVDAGGGLSVTLQACGLLPVCQAAP